MTTMRPWRSASGPANQAPIAEPRSAPATAKPSNQEAAPDQAPMASTAPLMTAVSKPKRNPPIAADAATSAILPIAMPSIDGLRAAGFLLSMVDMRLVDQREEEEFDKPQRRVQIKRVLNPSIFSIQNSSRSA